MFRPAGIRMRMSLAAVMVGVPASVTVMLPLPVGGALTTKVWLAADDTVCAPAGAANAPAATSANGNAAAAAARVTRASSVQAGPLDGPDARRRDMLGHYASFNDETLK